MLSFVLVGKEAFNIWIGGVREAIKKRKEVNAQAVTVVDRWIQKNFEGQGKEFGGWQPLSDVTLQIRRSRKSAPTDSTLILMDKGQLKTRWKHAFDDKTAVIQSGVPYARIHNEGGWVSFGAGTVKIPKRQILPDREMILPKLLELYSGDLKNKLTLKQE